MERNYVVRELESGEKMRRNTWKSDSYIQLTKLNHLLNEKQEQVTLPIYELFEDGWERYTPIPKIKEGDWVYVPSARHVNVKIVTAQTDKNWQFDDGQTIGLSFQEDLVAIRLATESEIKTEKNRRKWASLNREVNKFKTGDIVKYGSDTLTHVLYQRKDEVYFYNPKRFDHTSQAPVSYITLICPVENRYDT